MSTERPTVKANSWKSMISRSILHRESNMRGVGRREFFLRLNKRGGDFGGAEQSIF